MKINIKYPMLNFGNHISVRNSSGKESGDLNCLDKENILRLNLFQRAAGRESENTSQLTGLIESSLVMGGILEGNYTLYGSSWRGTTFSHSIEIIRFVKALSKGKFLDGISTKSVLATMIQWLSAQDIKCVRLT